MTPDEIKEIYARHGITTKVHPALAEVVSTVVARLEEKYNSVLLSLAMELEQLKSQRPAKKSTSGAVCYCGAVVTGGKCEVCGRQ